MGQKIASRKKSLQNAPMWSAVFPAAAHKFTPQPPLDKKVAYLKAIWQTDCCTMQLLNSRLTKKTFNIVLCWPLIHYYKVFFSK